MPRRFKPTAEPLDKGYMLIAASGFDAALGSLAIIPARFKGFAASFAVDGTFGLVATGVLSPFG